MPPPTKIMGFDGAPKAASLVKVTMPGSSTRPPVQLLLPVISKEPLPAFTSEPEPLKVPLKVVFWLLPPTTRFTVPLLVSFSAIAPLPEIPPTVNVPTPGVNCRPSSTLMLTVLLAAALELASCTAPSLRGDRP